MDCLVASRSCVAARPIPAGEIDIIATALPRREGLLRGGQLSVLAGGDAAPNPAEILAGPFFNQLVAEAGKAF